MSALLTIFRPFHIRHCRLFQPFLRQKRCRFEMEAKKIVLIVCSKNAREKTLYLRLPLNLKFVKWMFRASFSHLTSKFLFLAFTTFLLLFLLDENLKPFKNTFFPHFFNLNFEAVSRDILKWRHTIFSVDRISIAL